MGHYFSNQARTDKSRFFILLVWHNRNVMPVLDPRTSGQAMCCPLLAQRNVGMRGEKPQDERTVVTTIITVSNDWWDCIGHR